MIISTIYLAVLPAPTATPPKQPDKNTFKDRVKRQLVKIANWLLGLAKKALVSLPGILGGLISFVFKGWRACTIFLRTFDNTIARNYCFRSRNY